MQATAAAGTMRRRVHNLTSAFRYANRVNSVKLTRRRRRINSKALWWGGKAKILKLTAPEPGAFQDAAVAGALVAAAPPDELLDRKNVTEEQLATANANCGLTRGMLELLEERHAQKLELKAQV